MIVLLSKAFCANIFTHLLHWSGCFYLLPKRFQLYKSNHLQRHPHKIYICYHKQPNSVYFQQRTTELISYYIIKAAKGKFPTLRAEYNKPHHGNIRLLVCLLYLLGSLLYNFMYHCMVII